MRKSLIFVALGLLGAALMVTGAQARIWHVPSDVATVTEAIEAAGPGDTIMIADGVHAIVGNGFQLQPGLTIRSETGLPNGVILIESATHWQNWRDRPVFIMSESFSATAEVVFEGITFRDFTQAFGPNQYSCEPIFNVRNGVLIMRACTFDHYFGTAVTFDGGSGALANCTFLRGHGDPAAVEFAGHKLQLSDCKFRENTQRFPGDTVSTPDKASASLLNLVSGEIDLGCGLFEDNGPIVYLVNVQTLATMTACYTCMMENHSIWQGRVAGRVHLSCCDIDRSRWQIVDDGAIVDDAYDRQDYHEEKALSTRSESWTQVKSLFK